MPGPARTEKAAVGAVRDVVDAFQRNHLLTYASAMSFRIVFALVPFALFVLAVLGFLQLDEVWSRDVAPDVKQGVSPALYQVLDQAVRRVLSATQPFWLTAGGLIALWLVSGAVRAAMEALDEVYGCDRERSTIETIRRSLWLGAAAGGCLLAAGAFVRLGPLAIRQGPDDPVLGIVSFLVRWGAAVALLFLAVFLIVRYGATTSQPPRLVSRGSALAVGSWVLASAGFGAYLKWVASYGSVYGSLAVVIVLFSYVYLSTVAFLFGAQVDALVRANGD